LKDFADSNEFVSHSGLDKAVLEEVVSIMPDMLFAKVSELSLNLSSKGKIKSKPHGYSLRVRPRSDEIYEVAKKLIKDNPKAYSFKSSHCMDEYKINGRILADYIYENQLMLFGGSDFIGVEYQFFHEDIITKFGLRDGNLPKFIKKQV
jgi:hypothetical protein